MGTRTGGGEGRSRSTLEKREVAGNSWGKDERYDHWEFRVGKSVVAETEMAV